MKILVIGNGSTGVDTKSKKSYINNHTGWFLEEINLKATVGFSQFTTSYNRNSNLQNFDITSSSLNNHNLLNKKHPLFFIKLIKVLLQYDFIHIFYPGSLGRFVALIAKLLNKPYGLYIRGEYFNRNFFDKIVLKNSRYVFTISPTFLPKLKVFCKKIKIIKPMISIREKDLKKDRNYLNSGIVKLLFVGRLEEAKGVFELLTIATELKKKNFNFVIDIVGGGDLYNSLFDIIKAEGLSKHIVIHGQVSDGNKLKLIYDNANIFVFPSHHEGFPRVLYEAMASGLPIFTTFVGGISGRMKHNVNCIEIPVKDGVTSAKIISHYLSDSNSLELFAKSAQKTLLNIINGSLLSHEDLLIKYLQNER